MSADLVNGSINVCWAGHPSLQVIITTWLQWAMAYPQHSLLESYRTARLLGTHEAESSKGSGRLGRGVYCILDAILLAPKV